MKTVFETTASDAREDILIEATKLAEKLKPAYNKIAARKIKHAKKYVSLWIAKRALDDIKLMYELQSIDNIAE